MDHFARDPQARGPLPGPSRELYRPGRQGKEKVSAHRGHRGQPTPLPPASRLVERILREGFRLVIFEGLDEVWSPWAPRRRAVHRAVMPRLPRASRSCVTSGVRHRQGRPRPQACSRDTNVATRREEAADYVSRWFFGGTASRSCRGGLPGRGYLRRRAAFQPRSLLSLVARFTTRPGCLPRDE